MNDPPTQKIEKGHEERKLITNNDYICHLTTNIYQLFSCHKYTNDFLTNERSLGKPSNNDQPSTTNQHLNNLKQSLIHLLHLANRDNLNIKRLIVIPFLIVFTYHNFFEP